MRGGGGALARGSALLLLKEGIDGGGAVGAVGGAVGAVGAGRPDMMVRGAGAGG